MAQLGGQICVDRTRTGAAALVEQQYEDGDKDESRDTNLFLSDFLLDTREWTVGCIMDTARPRP